MPLKFTDNIDDTDYYLTNVIIKVLHQLDVEVQATRYHRLFFHIFDYSGFQEIEYNPIDRKKHSAYHREGLEC